MKIQRVSFLGVRGLADATFEFGQRESVAPAEIVILTGSPASGKTRALEAMIAAKEAIAPYGPIVQGAPWIAENSEVAKVIIAFYLDEEERAYAGASSSVVEAEVQFLPERARADADEGLVAVLDRYSHDRAKGKIEYFPASRRIPIYPPFGGLGAAEQRVNRPTKDARKYSFILRFLQEIAQSPASARDFAARLEAFSATCRYTGGLPEGVPHCFSSRRGAALSPFEISDSEADAVIFAAASVVLGLSRSILFVDRPELYADLRDAKRLVDGLRALGKDNQLILASSSAELVAAAEQARVVSLEGG